MMIVRNSHIPFAQLPIEAPVLFYMQSMSAWDCLCNWPHTSAEIYGDLERIWNAERLAPKDLRDWQRMSTLLETQLSKRIPQERSRIEPERTTRRRCRK